MTAGHWTEAATEWTAARTLLEPYASTKQGDRTLGDYLSDERSLVFTAVTAHAEALIATGITDRASLAAADDLMAIKPGSDLTKKWVSADRPAALARLVAAETASQVAVIEAERVRLAHSFVVWTESFGSDVKAKDLDDLTAALVKTLSERVAPCTVEIVSKPPVRPIGGACAHLALTWHCVSYSVGQFHMQMGPPVPDHLEATLTVASRFCTTNLDAGCVWSFDCKAPEQISPGQNYSLANTQTTALLSDLKAAFPTLAKLQDADQVALAFDKGAKSVRGLWGWVATSHTVNADKRRTMFGDYAAFGGNVIAAIQRRCPDVDLIPAKSISEPTQGTINVDFTVQEESFGTTENKALQTENGAVPTHMAVSVTVVTAARACSWDPGKHWQAEIVPPEHIAKSELPTMSSHLGDQLVKKITEQIAREPELTAK